MANKKNADIAEKVYWRDNKHFADLFNTVFFDGRQVIREEELTEADSEVSNYVFSKEDVSAISKTCLLYTSSTGEAGHWPPGLSRIRLSDLCGVCRSGDASFYSAKCPAAKAGSGEAFQNVDVRPEI